GVGAGGAVLGGAARSGCRGGRGTPNAPAPADEFHPAAGRQPARPLYSLRRAPAIRVHFERECTRAEVRVEQRASVRTDVDARTRPRPERLAKRVVQWHRLEGRSVHVPPHPPPPHSPPPL